ncbi:hypothetical protein BJY01DRAFT_259428 [Aspergillus pseudoustus]|uniref:NmrA-like domain-containing protein n=1 Tax=Aspergillus pseudoustus TaxID=1810923 RepID=A0ABR4J485_9EURO
MSTTIFVCGATGTQGGALINNILGSPSVKAHAVARDLSTPASLSLLAAGVTLFQGDFNDEASLRTAMHGCTALFINLMPNLADVTQELAQAQRLLSVAREVGVTHVVYSSGFSADHPERRRHYDPNGFVTKLLFSKQRVESAVRTAGFKYYTIIRPGNFMTNMLAPHVGVMYAGLVEKAEITTAFTRDMVLPMIDPNDIGRFALAAFLQPARFNAQEFEIASELMPFEDVVKAIGRVMGREVKINYLSQEDIDEQIKTNPFLGGQLMMRDMVECVDMDKVRAWGIPLGTFGEFLERESGRVKTTYGL